MVMYMNRLRDLREDRELTQTQLANMLGCFQTTYSRYEKEVTNIPIDCLVKLAIYYDTSIDYLIGLTDMRNPYKRSVRFSSKNFCLYEKNPIV